VSRVAVVGGGPAGLMAAETLAAGGAAVDVFDAMPSVGRKFLLAGKGGLNLTHSEPMGAFVSRYRARRGRIAPLVEAFGPGAIRAWAHALAIETFVGTSGRVFPKEMKAAPLLRRWLHRLREAGVRFHPRHRWLGWTDGGALLFDDAEADFDAVILALGGASWPRLGSDGAWVPILEQRGIAIAPLRPANCGFDVGWSAHLRSRFAGAPVKSVAARFGDFHRQGEFVITGTGVEGSLIYALSAAARDAIEATGEAVIHLDLAPSKTSERVAQEVVHPRGSRSWSSHLQSRAGITGVRAALLRELHPDFADAAEVAAAIKALPLRLAAPRPLAEAISTAGGVPFEALDDALMLRALPGVFCAGEMLDWEAPTGGYLLTACFATGRRAGEGALQWLASGAEIGKLPDSARIGSTKGG
jgi:uncharacterized flavoprotein (TIGR03862 family)